MAEPPFLMILCDMDGVLATGPGRDTEPGKPIYRTFPEPPGELERIRAAGVPIHVVTAKVEAEAVQVLEAVGLAGRVDSVVGANRLFWPSIWNAVRRGRLPGSLTKSVYRTVLPVSPELRIVMIEDRRKHLREMLAAGTIDFGVLVPSISVSDDRVVEWFDLNLALRLARGLVMGSLDIDDLVEGGVGISTGGGEDVDVDTLRRDADGPIERGRYLLRLPTLSFPSSPHEGPTLEELDTGRILAPGPPSPVSVARAGLRALRRTMGRFQASSF